MHALLLAAVLASAPHLAQSELARLRRSVPLLLKGPLAALAPPLEAARQGTKPSVANVRTRLKAMRALETAARALLADPAIDPVRVHQTLALGWGDLAELEGALAIEGEGDELQRDAVRTTARSRAEDAEALAASELEIKRARGLAAEVAKRQQPALDACWQEHLLSTSDAATVERTATLAVEKGRVQSVAFDVPLTGPLQHLGECLQTRILGWQLTDDADALELPLRFTAPNR